MNILQTNENDIHRKINIKQYVAEIAIRKGEQVPYGPTKSKFNYAIDVSYWGSVKPVGTDPEDTTIYRNHLAEFSKFGMN